MEPQSSSGTLLQTLPEPMSLPEFLLALLLSAILCLAVRVYYLYFGNSLSNRAKFASIFLPLGLTTTLIIATISYSPLLSLGLVGALSIVRYRAAIKDPEELTYIFLVIAIGLTCGAGLSLMAAVGSMVILLSLYVGRFLSGAKSLNEVQLFHIYIRTEEQDLNKIDQILANHFPERQMRQLEDEEGKLLIVYQVVSRKLSGVEEGRKSLLGLGEGTNVSVVQKAEVLV